MMGDDDNAIAVADPFARRLMAQYIERREQELQALSRSVAEEDFETIVLTAHKLYGSGSAYGHDEITRLGGELEKAAELRESDKVAALVRELESYVLHVKLT